MQSARATQAAKTIGQSSFDRGSVKVPELALIEQDAAVVPEELLAYLLYEQISGQELLLLSRNDMLNGQDVSYAIIKNLSDVAFEYASSNLVPLPGTLAEIFRQYGIVLENYIPVFDPDSPTSQNYWPNFYIEEENNIPVLTVEFQNIQDNMLVELEVVGSGRSVSTSHGLA